jgi:hypothetical protein
LPGTDLVRFRIPGNEPLGPVPAGRRADADDGIQGFPFRFTAQLVRWRRISVANSVSSDPSIGIVLRAWGPITGLNSNASPQDNLRDLNLARPSGHGLGLLRRTAPSPTGRAEDANRVLQGTPTPVLQTLYKEELNTFLTT